MAHGEALGVATGFVVERGGGRFLITSRHVVRGRSNDARNRILHPSGAWPDSVTVMHHVAGILGSWRLKTEILYFANGSPRWLEHPVHGPLVDVVALPLTETDGCDIYGYDPWATGDLLAVGVARPLFIIGFPFGVTGGGSLGVWVQGTVATELDVDWQGLPAFLIDSRTQPGQSGSPVIAFHTGGPAAMEGGRTFIRAGRLERFMGVYSGRINDESDLGVVWKTSVVVEVVEGGMAMRPSRWRTP
jgi:hypothetical protein